MPVRRIRALRLFPLVLLPLLAGCGAAFGGLATVSSVAVQSRPATGGFAGLASSAYLVQRSQLAARRFC